MFDDTFDWQKLIETIQNCEVKRNYTTSILGYVKRKCERGPDRYVDWDQPNYNGCVDPQFSEILTKVTMAFFKIHKVGIICIFVLFNFWNKLEIVINEMDFNSVYPGRSGPFMLFCL